MTILIDLSYFIFYRYYAIYNWYRKQNEAKDAVMTDPVFIEKYDKIFEQTIEELIKKFDVTWDSVYFAKDCPREEIWRMQYYSDYKKSRDEKLVNFDKEIFKHSICNLIPKLQTKYGGCHILSVSNMEADDIIAVVKKHIRSLNTEKEIVIITNDSDYIQLIDEYTLVVNLQGKDLKSRIDCSPNEYLEKKIIMGDKSDNITSIAKKIGEKTAAKLAGNLEKFFETNPEAKKKYDLNMLLISFEMIPADLAKKAVAVYEKTF